MAHTNQRQYELRYFELDNQIAKLAGTNLPVIQEKQNYVFEEELLIPRDDHAYEGYFNSAKYFSEIADTIRTDFRLKPEYESTLPPDLLSSINNHCSVSIHVRRGDYATKPTIQSYHGICGLEYYEKAITEIIGHTTQPQFFIFSDDIKWCRENIQPLFSQIDPTKNIPEPIFVSGLRPYQDLILMSRCRHQIIANSTFSWWAAWLNNNPDKIVIAPQSWLKDKNSSTPDLLPPEWLKI
jgi:hypothetical protein